jgi:two-component system chemotaxis response regulator CheB
MPSASPSVGHVVVVGASAGGVEALIQLVEGLPADLPAPVLVVLHVAAGPSHLPAILCRAGKLPVSHATDGETLAGGKIYVAPPDRHIEVRQDRVKLNGGPRQNRVRPSADVLFRSAAEVYSTRAIGVILTGLLDDGAAGLAAIKRAGGLAVVQDPRDAQNASMPEAAIAATEVDHVVPVAQIGPLAAVRRPPRRGRRRLSGLWRVLARDRRESDPAVQMLSRPSLLIPFTFAVSR